MFYYHCTSGHFPILQCIFSKLTPNTVMMLWKTFYDCSNVNSKAYTHSLYISMEINFVPQVKVKGVCCMLMCGIYFKTKKLTHSTLQIKPIEILALSLPS